MQDQRPSASTTKHRRFGERGQSVIEFAILAPLLVFIVLALMEVGHGLNSYLTVVSAARDAARLGAEGQADEAEMRNLVGKEVGDTLPSTLPTTVESCGSAGVCITQPTVGGNNAVKVTVCYDHPMLIGAPFLTGPIHMCSTTTMRLTNAS
jgi:Flp pilus assembly protein TadG